MAAPATKPSSSLVTEPAPSEPEQLNVVETPTSPSSAFALSRFEFETGRGNEGTKILMVQWDSSAAVAAAGVNGTGSSDDLADWEVSWEGETKVLPVRDTETESPSTKRVYYLLPPGAHVPPLVNIAWRRQQHTAAADGPVVMLRTKPMPAIFPEGLGPGNKDTGKRGVLHSIWARKRLAELEAEIAAEMRANSESIGLEMAIQDRQWITEHFGVGDPSALTAGVATTNTNASGVPYPLSPRSPTSPGGPRSPGAADRLGEKLRGLKLATSPAELAAATQASRAAATQSAHAGGALTFSALHARAFPKTAIEQKTMGSLDAVIGGGGADGHAKGVREDGADTEEELFALPMSPRSPEMARSPFSLL